MTHLAWLLAIWTPFAFGAPTVRTAPTAAKAMQMKVPVLISGLGLCMGLSSPGTLPTSLMHRTGPASARTLSLPAATKPTMPIRRSAKAEASDTGRVMGWLGVSPQAQDLMRKITSSENSDSPTPEEQRAKLNAVFDASLRLSAVDAIAASRQENPIDTRVNAKLVKGDIFDPAFIAKKKTAPPTVVFDLDDTIGTNEEGQTGTAEYFLRLGIVSELKKLIKDGFHLSLWTASPARNLKMFFRKYPALLRFFDEFITAENWVMPALMETADSKFRAAYARARPDRVAKFYSAENPKDISLFRDKRSRHGYVMLVDDNPELPAAAAKAPFGSFPVYNIKGFDRVKDDEPVEQLADHVLALLPESK
jgi:hypothetical protein